ncbi:hypothetical protein NG891_00550 [Enterococcus gallinarum]|uniref:hypothetical protein n=1 Tax=Enterococcus gallinarum TaxID=1353 RepID=UPI00209093F6|nr:hypothetical protein [Enterococcus gallinarum]MCO5475207.1 hypothetical protein [Enterococcus gallinarum]
MGIWTIAVNVMFVFSIGVIVFGGISFFRRSVLTTGERCFVAIILVLCGFMMMSIIPKVNRIVTSHLVLSKETNVIETIHLVSLGNTEKINGTIHQGLLSLTTTVNEKPIYRFVYKKDGGLVAIGEIDAATPVKETNDGKPRIETVEHCYTNKHTRLLLGDCLKETETTIYIPQDSIVQDFKIDINK